MFFNIIEGEAPRDSTFDMSLYVIDADMLALGDSLRDEAWRRVTQAASRSSRN